MEYRTILVQLDNPERARRVVQTALKLAEKFDSFVAGLYVVPSLDTLGALASGGTGPTVVRQRRAQLFDIASECEAIFKTQLENTKRNWSWSVVESAHEVIGQELLSRSQTTDLVVLSQTPDDEDILFVAEPPERLILESGKPVVVVPDGYEASDNNLQTLLVAWDGSKEASRALSDSIPLLQRAQNVRVVRFVPDDAESETHREVAAGLKEYLARHGVEIEISLVTTETSDVPAVLQATSQEGDYDLLVCGGYGESRLKEYLLGGVTRHLLAHSKVPLFMAH